MVSFVVQHPCPQEVALPQQAGNSFFQRPPPGFPSVFLPFLSFFSLTVQENVTSFPPTFLRFSFFGKKTRFTQLPLSPYFDCQARVANFRSQFHSLFLMGFWFDLFLLPFRTLSLCAGRAGPSRGSLSFHPRFNRLGVSLLPTTNHPLANQPSCIHIISFPLTFGFERILFLQDVFCCGPLVSGSFLVGLRLSSPSRGLILPPFY